MAGPQKAGKSGSASASGRNGGRGGGQAVRGNGARQGAARGPARAGSAAKSGPAAKSGTATRADAKAKAKADAKAGTKAKAGTATAARRTSDAAQTPATGWRRITEPFSSVGWLPLTTFILSLVGLGISIYLTIAHYDTKVTLACPDTGVVNCAKVTTSPESIVFGIFPVAVLGLAFYIFMTCINSPWAWKSKLPAIYWARLGSVIIGMVFVLYLVYAEVIEIGNICLFCTSVHIITFLLFTLLVFHASARGTGTADPARR
jgi:uncharacterized membrane protein